MNRRPKHSTARNPFESFREFAIRLDIDTDLLDGTPWTSARCKDFFVFWEEVPPILGRKNLGLSEALANLYAGSETPLVTVLASLSVNMFRLLQQVQAAPTREDLIRQFSSMNRQLEGLASLAQGGTSKGTATTSPSWLHTPTDPDESEKNESALRDAVGRSPSLHPMLHDVLFLTLQKGISTAVDDVAYWSNEAHLKKKQQLLLSFFESISQVQDIVAEAERLCRADATMLNAEGRAMGAPADVARDWLLVRLLWIWRDVLGHEIKIYARRVENRVELDVPQPNSCMDFVVSVLRHVQPVRPNQLQPLERKLTALRAQVPTARLAIPNF